MTTAEKILAKIAYLEQFGKPSRAIRVAVIALGKLANQESPVSGAGLVAADALDAISSILGIEEEK